MTPPLRYPLAPFALLYGIAVKVRNLLFDTGVLTGRSFGVPTICIGNLTVGGTGKTPHTEMLLAALLPHFRVAVLSRGYRRRSNGFRVVEPDSDVREVGDEPLQIKRGFPGATVAVCEHRVQGIETLLGREPSPEVILLDDAFQHRHVRAGLNILLTDHDRLITRDYFLPLGCLRDSLSEKSRADVVIVTKCPRGLKPIEQRIISKELALMPYQTLYYTAIAYGALTPLFPQEPNLQPTHHAGVLALAGVANPSAFFDHLAQQFPLADTLELPDHAPITARRIRGLAARFDAIAAERKIIITTQKDAMRLQAFDPMPQSLRERLYYLPIRVEVLNGAANDLITRIISYVRKSKGNGGPHTR